ncbi:sporulation phosphorelay system protein KapB [Alkalicoccobacillus porphyridii]|uniref:Kinase n=1 Tax=Alkalicoccobacillus porphyridii TaxID=2597270 RepID=A0A553ZZV4_9BACI|nr:sporulation phosphorelay system protein KapB [Alkalicoccobacillus porphyridii]TSB46979.1 kinase [Alkalicoccobacillus porphyridii]
MKLERALFKTGKYVCERLETDEANRRALIKVLAVLKHPTQGDLHHPKQTDVPLFHERKALAEFEKAWVPLSTLRPYDGEKLSYQHSLQEAWEEQYQQLEQDGSEWARQSQNALLELKNEYRFE